ncbi:MAG: methyltransferase domain-containing protein [Alphaproteobacteria bacterium]|nr:methyltransferase domain-containing protein [Alphaproteobacteria bacterium]
MADRLRAWWEGCAVADIVDQPPALPAERDPAPLAEVPERPAANVETFSEDPADGRYWTPRRIAVAERLWGEGEIAPGGVERTLDMIRVFGLRKEVNVLNIGPGLGGTAHHIAKEFDAWVIGYEEDPYLVEAAVDRMARAGLSKKAEMNQADFAELELRANIFDCAFGRETLYTVADRENLLMAIQDGLKAHCPLLFSDYFVARGREDDAEVHRWMEAEPETVHPWSIEEAEEVLCQTNFELRVIEDMSATIRDDVFAGWARFVEAHKATGIPPDLMEAVLDAAELWARRVAALDSGAVSVQKIFALKI